MERGVSLDWSGQTVLVTGADGFIGSHLTERLVAIGAKTRALVQYNSFGSWGWLGESPSREELEVFLGDVRDSDSLRAPMRGVDVVFHLAALIAIPYSYQAPRSYLDTNATGTLNVLSAALSADARRVVHTSTSEVYGTARFVPISEAHPLQAQSPYSASKIAGDKIAEAFHRCFGLPVATLRPFNTYGPRQSARAVIPTIVTQLLVGETVELGNLEPTRDFTYVSDTVDGFLAIAGCDDAIGEVVNLGSQREISIGDLVTLIARRLDRDAVIVGAPERVRPPASEVDRLCADASRAKALLGWEPETSLESGLRETIRWLAENLDRYKLGTFAV